MPTVQHGPSLDQLQAHHEAGVELPTIADGDALELCRTHARSVWLREGYAAGVLSAKVLGRYTVGTDLGLAWPVLAVRVLRRKGPLGRRRLCVLLLTRTRPGRWTVWEHEAMPSSAKRV